MTEKRIQKLKRKLQEARYRLLTRCTEFAAPLVDMLFVATDDVRRMSTNGSCIYFDAAWLDKLDDWSLEFALCHQLMHLELGHLDRPQYYRGDRFHFAANVVANSHLFLYGFAEEKLPGIGVIHHETFFPKIEGREVDALKAMSMIPFDPARLPDAKRRSYLLDSDDWWDRPEDRGESGTIILSPADQDPEDLIPSPEVIARIELILFRKKDRKENKAAPPKIIEDESLDEFNFEYISDWHPNLKEALQELRSLKEQNAQNGNADAMYERILNRATIPTRNWRALLNHFIMDETRDYSFTPPDRRMQDLDFFLPDYNEAETPRLNVLFMVDTSASVKDSELDMAVAEICSAIEQFNGMLQGRVGFFDTSVRSIRPITSVADLLRTSPKGGGGTDLSCVFDYIHSLSEEDRPSEIVIVTDGKADFPDYSESMNIPVLWLLTSNRVRVPWGQAAWFGQ